MAVLVISLMVGIAAMVVLLGCLKGFSRAVKHKKLSGLLVGVQEGSGAAKQAESLVEFPPAKSKPVGDPPRPRISNGTVALVGLAILLGSRGIPGKSRPVPGKGERTQVSGVQLLRNS